MAYGLGEVLADSRLLLVAPGLSTESCKALTDTAMWPETKIPILELLPANGGEAVGIQGADAVPWPCPMKELQQGVEQPRWPKTEPNRRR